MHITAVSYLNTKPFLYGLLHSTISEKINLQLEIPSLCAKNLREGKADLGLIPVAALTEIPNAVVISDYCIAADGEVKTVCIFSDVPIEQIQAIYLDYHSRTSVELAKILCKEHWNVAPEFLPAFPDFEQNIKGKVAGLVIGDRAMGLHHKFPYVYDLGQAWKEMTGLPFVFAAWIKNRPLAPDFLQEFNSALQMGLEHIPQLIYLLPSPPEGFDLHAYFTHHIHYHLDEDKMKGLRLFLSKLSTAFDERIFVNWQNSVYISGLNG